jgi:site-specific recombinase XerD
VAELPAAPLHVACHISATPLLEGGVDEQTRTEILGHTSVSAQRGYAHVDRTLARQATTALDQLLA